MNFNWSDYLKLAKELIQTSSQSHFKESALRSSISRSYYAAFCSTRNYLLCQKCSLPSDNTIHREIRITLEQSGNTESLRIAQNLRRLHNMRKKADYDDNITSNINSMAIDALIKAEDIIDTLKDP
jgi:uncharacterized protein (UPF0332 family)